MDKFPCSIEPLEARIAPAMLTVLRTGSVLTYTDIDGDLVKVSFPKQVMEPGDFTFSTGAVDGDITTKQQLTMIDLQTHNGASVTVTATPQKIGGFQQGDSHANVKLISASNTNLGAVKVDGDVQAIVAVEVKSFSALSFGNQYYAGGLNVSELSTVGSFAVKGDIAGHISLTVTGDVKSFTVGGTIGTVGSYRLQFNGNVGVVKVGGSIIGHDSNKSLVVSGEVGAFSVGGSIIGSNSDLSGATQIDLGKVKMITIGGDLYGKAGKGGGSIAVRSGTVGAIKIVGSMIGGVGVNSAQLSLNASAGSITVGGNLQGGDGIGSAAIFAKSVGKITIGGSISGSAAGENSGIIFADDVGSVTVGHDLVSRGNNGFIALDGPLKTLKIGGDIRCEDTVNPSTTAVVSVAGVLGSLTVGGSVLGEADHVARIVVGGAGAAPGAAALKSMAVKHSVVRAAIASGFSSEAGSDSVRNSQSGLGSISIGGDLSGSYIIAGGTVSGDRHIGTHDDGLVAKNMNGRDPGIASLKIGGALTGLVNDPEQYQVYSRNIQKVTIGRATYTYAQLLVDSPNFDAIGHAVVICPS